jgi:hypothetical protein
MESKERPFVERGRCVPMYRVSYCVSRIRRFLLAHSLCRIRTGSRTQELSYRTPKHRMRNQTRVSDTDGHRPRSILSRNHRAAFRAVGTRRSALFLILLVVSVVSFQDKVFGQPVPNASPSGSIPANSTAAPNDVAAMNRQIDLISRFDERLLTTVYFCLGALLSGFAVLLGYNWFTNFRGYERDKRQLCEELTNTFNARFTALEKEINDAISKIEAKVVSATQERVKTEIASIRQNITDLQVRNLEGQREEWIRQGTLSNALRYATQVVRLLDESGNRSRIHGALGSMRSIVDKLLVEKTLGPDSNDMAEMTRVLNRVEEANPIVVANLKAELAKLPPRI